ncbi:zinc finger, C2H2 type, partial [Oesophagostomum dentatum]
FVLPEDECPFACRKCHRGFYTIKELAEHEIRAHDMKIPCPHCDKNAVSITKLAAHMLFRHPAMDVVCHYCDQKFGGPADKLDKAAWDDFRGHVY